MWPRGDGGRDGAVEKVDGAVLAFQDHHEQIATPFEWKFTTDDLLALLERIAAQDNPARAKAA